MADEKQLSNVVENIWLEMDSGKATSRIAGIVRNFLENNGLELGLPPSEANEAVVLLYDAVFDDVDTDKTASEIDKDDFASFLKEILLNFAEQLEANPVYHGTDH